MPFADLTLREFTAALAADEPVPGGGSAGAIAGVLASALVAKVAAVATRRAGDGDPSLRTINAAAHEQQARLLDLADRDADAYQEVVAAYRLPKGTDAQKAHRRTAVQGALRTATEVPLESAERCAQVISLADVLAPLVSGPVVSDLEVARALARASLASVSAIAQANLAGLRDAAYVNEAATRLDRLTAGSNSGRESA